MGFDRYQSASDLVNNGFQQPDKEDILKLWVFLVSLTSYDIHQYGWAWGAGRGRIYELSEIPFKSIWCYVFFLKVCPLLTDFQRS